MKIVECFKSLTKFEYILWICSLISVTCCFMLAPDKDYLTLIACLIGVTALIFVAKGFVLGQILTVVFAVFYGIISFYFEYYGEMITYLCMTSPIAIMSVITWMRHPYEGSNEVAIKHLSKKNITIMIILTILTTYAFYFILGALGTANLIISTISVTTSFLASYLTLMRNPYYAVAYGANDIVLIILWVLASIEDIAYLPMVACFVVFFVNDGYGFINWQRMKHRQNS